MAALSPVLDPQGNITRSGQLMAERVFETLKNQKEALLKKQDEISNTIRGLEDTMKSLEFCFQCKKSSCLEQCGTCERGPEEITMLGKQLLDTDKKTTKEDSRNI